eukprot:361367-Chlamydomonas_euryale.AAC.12
MEGGCTLLRSPRPAALNGRVAARCLGGCAGKRRAQGSRIHKGAAIQICRDCAVLCDEESPPKYRAVHPLDQPTRARAGAAAALENAARARTPQQPPASSSIQPKPRQSVSTAAAWPIQTVMRRDPTVTDAGRPSMRPCPVLLRRGVAGEKVTRGGGQRRAPR